ncbi:OLC1v1005041C1 [Oldenlandia corymbosa var. corymbosa]|uniref:OLC1v1005041C1 n=1 Tax=Oldenlandia corymbosa var. corymbosa TaxID=529605 RepID=A0AAV1DEG3_OLDCO|nr:OLC1v1005041C1 [Oldenlandia corymbosa var. corymbosa]
MPGLRHSFERSAPNLDDCIGVESCVDWVPGVNFAGIGIPNKTSTARDQRRRNKPEKKIDEEKKKQFPPPLPWLARTDNLYSFMKRDYTDDGRLVIREEKVEKQDFLRADRSVNGRLTLRLVPITDNKDEGVYAADEEEEEEVDGVLEEEVEEESRILNLEDGSFVGNEVPVEDNGGEDDNGGGGMIYKHCNQSRRNSCIFDGGGGVAVAAVRSVHT